MVKIGYDSAILYSLDFQDKDSDKRNSFPKYSTIYHFIQTNFFSEQINYIVSHPSFQQQNTLNLPLRIHHFWAVNTSVKVYLFITNGIKKLFDVPSPLSIIDKIHDTTVWRQTPIYVSFLNLCVIYEFHEGSKRN